MQVSVSIHDFSPLLRDLEYLYRGMKEAGADSLELLVGVKSRFRLKKIQQLSQKYDLPVLTLHQPIWSGLGWWLDEGFVALGAELGAKAIVLHPLVGVELESPAMDKYLSKFSVWQEKYGLTFCLENMPEEASSPFFKTFLPLAPSQADLRLLARTAARYGFKTTYDASHTMYSRPHERSDFLDIFPTIGNIHISSFRPGVEHLPLDMGELQAESFINFLKTQQYGGILTLELFYPSMLTAFKYDFGAIARSIKLVKKR